MNIFFLQCVAKLDFGAWISQIYMIWLASRLPIRLDKGKFCCSFSHNMADTSTCAVTH